MQALQPSAWADILTKVQAGQIRITAKTAGFTDGTAR